MTPELRGLYHEAILDHARNPRNCRPLPGATCRAEGFNPLCGDQTILFLRIEGELIAEITFQGQKLY